MAAQPFRRHVHRRFREDIDDTKVGPDAPKMSFEDCSVPLPGMVDVQVLGIEYIYSEGPFFRLAEEVQQKEKATVVNSNLPHCPRDPSSDLGAAYALNKTRRLGPHPSADLLVTGSNVLFHLDLPHLLPLSAARSRGPVDASIFRSKCGRSRPHPGGRLVQPGLRQDAEPPWGQRAHHCSGTKCAHCILCGTVGRSSSSA